MDLQERMMRSFGINPSEDERPKIAVEGEMALLADALLAFSREDAPLAVGNLVRQKPACACYDLPSDNGLAIVVEVLPEPILGNEGNSSSNFFRERMDVVVGVWVARKGQFVLFYVDSRRFERVP